ncbi:FGGY-family carbohydrate kinase [Leucobacter komagatae]|uniref:Carbohydrate kinase n=1 Tax=Leucobacter komagatae TaxID=55969 RepID=A0A0D0IQE3_9MICO|nr:FGGY family carbohydrate kinase [Leucobacter komagatae]KIP53252.1 hypothetical protein SD72_03000 [Leucobacter komagatae]
MLIYAVDLGTTNIKVVLYNESLVPLATTRAPMHYRRDRERVEFDPEALFELTLELIRECASEARATELEHARIVVTGQAESLVVVDRFGLPVMPGLSWMDGRSTLEAREISERFDQEVAFAVTGEPESVATWPASKLRWLAMHMPTVLAHSNQVLMVKDYVLLRLTGLAVGEESTRGFSYLFDVQRRCYWDEMVAFCGITQGMLPRIVPAGSDIGGLQQSVVDLLPRARSYTVNVGALDHFCAMVGTDSYREGTLSVSAGTVLSFSALDTDWVFDSAHRASFHPGLRSGETVLFTCADGGGVSLSWFMDNISPGMSYDDLGRELAERDHTGAPLFLPYLAGMSPPDYNESAQGAFLGLELRHDRVDLGFAVMEGVAHLLRSNVDDFANHGRNITGIVSTGGGTASSFWNQLKADVGGVEFRVPDEPEAACRGAAVLALAAAGIIDSIVDTSSLHRPTERTYRPLPDHLRDTRYASFRSAVQKLHGAGS